MATTEPQQHEKPQHPSDDLSRRTFVALAAGACAACGCGLTADEALAQADDAAAAAPAKDAPKQIDVGPLADFGKDGVSDKWAKKPNQFLVIRNAGRLYAPSSVCTHKRCILKVKDDAIACPCHKSAFSNDGVPTSGQAKIALFRYGVSVDDKGHVIVDKTKQFEEKDWEKDGASLPVA